MKEFEVIQYHFLGLQLQEPISLIYNWLVAILCLIWFFKLKPTNESVKNWRYFFLVFAITGFFAGLAHTFYQYTGIYGKMPHWVGGIVSGYFAGKAMLALLNNSEIKKKLLVFLKVKLLVNIALALSFVTFLYVILDSALTYIIFCAGISIYLIKRGEKHLKTFVYAVIISFFGAFGFLFKLDLSLYFNREDFSHLFILISLILFYFGAKEIEKRGINLKFSSNEI
ncbi:MAG TPA: hypothetical protein PLP27_09170 [Crocinitomicaceae bacterium]|nr:hypothetical protein [Crocinitomicaceae bacterium]